MDAKYSKLFEDIKISAQYIDEYKEELMEKGVKSTPNAKEYANGYMDALIYILKMMDVEDPENIVKTARDEYNKKRISEDAPKFNKGDIIVKHGMHLIILDSYTITNRFGDKKDNVVYAVEYVKLPMDDPCIYKVKLKDKTLTFDLNKVGSAKIYHDDKTVKRIAKMNDSMYNKMKKTLEDFNKTKEELYSNLPK